MRPYYHYSFKKTTLFIFLFSVSDILFAPAKRAAICASWEVSLLAVRLQSNPENVFADPPVSRLTQSALPQRVPFTGVDLRASSILQSNQVFAPAMNFSF